MNHQKLTAVGALLLSVVATGCVTRSTPLEQKYQDSERSGRCYVHRESMERVGVPIYHGFFIQEGGPGQLRLKRFPFADWYTVDGGPITPTSPTTIVMWHCRSCEKEKLLWMRSHPDDQWTKDQWNAKKPNQPPEPMATSVTPPAAQESRQP